ncbi:MAG TPA: hypothetical protein VL633_10780, partial [Bacteroidota bacterium]|nr:hypothetical protein [Bacteroidota bacterium]
ASSQISILGKTVGNIFSINTLGTVIGALGAGLILIPLVGLKHTIEIGIVFNIAGAFIVTMVDANEIALKKTVLVSALALTAVLSVLSGSEWNKLIMLSGVFRQINRNITPPESFEAFANMNGDNKTLFYKEGASATVAVLDGPYFVGRQRVLFVNGKPDASSAGDLPTQELIAQLPMMLHPNPQDVLVVGLGSGVTLGSALTHKIRSADCVELLPEVVEASHQFEDVNYRPLSDPRTRLHVDDALSYLKLTDRTYDVIVSEPTNPWIAGVGNLFTNEFFARCKDRLNPGGMMVQWFHLYEMDDETIRLVLRTFRGSFANVSVWQSYSNDVILVGSNQPIALNAQAMKARFEIETVKRDLYRINITNVPALLSLQMVSSRNSGDYAGFGDINSEDLPLLEYRAPRSFFVNKPVVDLIAADERLIQNSGKSELLLLQYQRQFGLTDEEVRSVGALHAIGDGGNLAVGYSFLLKYLEKYPDDIDILQLTASVERKMGKRDVQLMHLEKLAKLRPNDAKIVSAYAWEKYQALQGSQTSLTPAAIREPEEILHKCIDMAGDTVDRYHVLLGDMYVGTGNSPQAVDEYRKALEIREQYGATDRMSQDALLVKFARAISRSGDDKNALSYAMQAYSMNPQNAEAKDMVYALYMKQTGKKLLKD